MKRNREQIDKNGNIINYINVLNGYLNGKEIEYRNKEGDKTWRSTSKPIFDFHHLEYRIKPKPAYRPYLSGNEAFVEISEHEPFGWLYNTVNPCYEQVICIGDNGISTHNDDYSFEQAFEIFIYPNDEKFGVKSDDNNNEEI